MTRRFCTVAAAVFALFAFTVPARAEGAENLPLTLNADHVVKGGHSLGPYMDCIGGPAEPQRYPPFVDWLGHSHEGGRIQVSSFTENPDNGEVTIGETFLYLWTICRAPLAAFIDECKGRKYPVQQCYAALVNNTNEFVETLLTYPPKVR
jgi:hypothetical protein